MPVLLIDDGGNQVKNICQNLEEHKCHFLVLDKDFISNGGEISFSYADTKTSGSIKSPEGKVLNLSDIGAVYCRVPYYQFLSDKVSDDYKRSWADNNSKASFENLLHGLSCSIMNNPSNSIFANNKIKQYQIANKFGIKTPPTSITNSPSYLSEFRKHHGRDIAYKALYGHIKWHEKAIYTNLLSEDDFNMYDEMSVVLSYFQKYIDKKLEIRSTVVGNQCFSCEIHSQKSESTKVDWRRYDLANTPHYAHTLPNFLSNGLISLVKEVGLNYGAFDLILDKKGDYWLLELNPDGIYDWVENLAGLQISKAIADWLYNEDVKYKALNEASISTANTPG